MKYDSDFLEHQAEGWGHWRILEAAVARDDPERAAGISAVFALQSAAPAQLTPSIYCYVLRVVDEDLDLVSDEAFGALEDASNVDCTGELGIVQHADHGDHDDHDDHGHDDHDDHGHGDHDHDDHDDHEGHDHGNEDEDADQESRQVGGRR